jgi:glycosyltransferase involved in cell wall biosynthesis
MRLLFNATNIRSEGGVVLMRHLLEGFLAYTPEMQILLYLNPELTGRLAGFVTEHPRIELVSFRPRGSWGRFRWEQVTLPGIIRKEKVDILFSFGNTGPVFPGCRHILYLQQSIPFTDYVPDRHRLQWWVFQRLYGFLIGLAQLGSCRVVVPTTWLVDPLRRSVLFLKRKAAYRVTLPGIPELSPLPPGGTLSANEIELLERMEAWRASDERILLYPCYLAPYKNIPWLLEAISHLGAAEPPPFRLLLTFNRESGEYFPCKKAIFKALDRLNSDWPDSDRVVLAGSLSRYAMAEVYRRADILVFPSLVETLGLPLLEAMSHGIPVVAVQSEKQSPTQAAFAREICADAAFYAEPGDPAAFATQIEKLLADPMLAFETGQKGLSRISEISWAAHVRAILADLP